MSTTGPFTTDWVKTNERGDRVESYHQDKYKSHPVLKTAPLPYFMQKGKITQAGAYMDVLNHGALPWIYYYGSRPTQRVLQTAYGKLVDKVKTSAQGWGENLATRKQAYSMMLHRVATLTTAARRLKRGDIPGFCRALGVPEKRSRSRSKNLASTWLEYHFGWEPLYGDIYTACKMLSADVPSGTLRGVGVEQVDDLITSRYSQTRMQGRVIAVLQGDYYVENPDKFLLNQLGVINPIGLAWELVPFSFAVDWFIPVGQFLGGLTDFVGVGRRNEFTTLYYNLNGLQWVINDPPGVSWGHTGTVAHSVSRNLGISVPKPTLKLFRGFSPARGATAIALLVGMLRSLR